MTYLPSSCPLPVSRSLLRPTAGVVAQERNVLREHALLYSRDRRSRQDYVLKRRRAHAIRVSLSDMRYKGIRGVCNAVVEELIIRCDCGCQESRW